MANSRSVTSNQIARHPDLLVALVKHLEKPYQRPISEHSRIAFEQCQAQLQAVERGIILDSGCGVGRSTIQLAEQHPDHWLVGVDQSKIRLDKIRLHALPDNVLFVRANLVDFWRLALQAGWHLSKHYLLYPNPWPKKDHLKRRWHGHPVFPTLVNLKGELELRTNWKLYAQELRTVLDYMNFSVSEVEELQLENYISPFEEKYQLSGQAIYRLAANLN